MDFFRILRIAYLTPTGDLLVELPTIHPVTFETFTPDLVKVKDLGSNQKERLEKMKETFSKVIAFLQASGMTWWLLFIHNIYLAHASVLDFYVNLWSARLFDSLYWDLNEVLMDFVSPYEVFVKISLALDACNSEALWDSCDIYIKYFARSLVCNVFVINKLTIKLHGFRASDFMPWIEFYCEVMFDAIPIFGCLQTSMWSAWRRSATPCNFILRRMLSRSSNRSTRSNFFSLSGKKV